MGEQGETVSLRITLRYESFEELVERFGDNVSSAGLFLHGSDPKPPGTKIRFELLLADGRRALRGEGVVVGARDDEVSGMAVRFGALEPSSRELVERIVQMHGQGALAPTPLSTVFASGSAGPSGPRVPWRAAGWTPAGTGARPGRTALSRSALSRLNSSKSEAPETPSEPPPPRPSTESDIAEAIEVDVDPIALAGAPVPSISEDVLPSSHPAEAPPDLAPETPGALGADSTEAADTTHAETSAIPDPEEETLDSLDPEEASLAAHLSSDETLPDSAETLQDSEETLQDSEETLQDSEETLQDSEETLQDSEEPTLDSPFESGEEPPGRADANDTLDASDVPRPDSEETLPDSEEPTLKTLDPESPASDPTRPEEEALAASDPADAGPEPSGEAPGHTADREGPAISEAASSQDVDASPPASEAPDPEAPPPEGSGVESGDLVLDPLPPRSSAEAATTIPISDLDAPHGSGPGMPVWTPSEQERSTPTARATGPRTPVALELGYDWVRLATQESSELGFIPLEGGSPQLAALVAAEGDGRLVLGSRARELAAQAPERSVSVLGLLEALSNPADHRALDDRLVRDEREGFVLTLGSHRFDASDVLVLFLRGLVRSFRKHLGHDHVRLFISTPAHVGDTTLATLRSALREAEVEAFRLEPEPQVVFRAYHLDDHPVDVALCVDVGPLALTLTLARRTPHGLRSIEFQRSATCSARAFDTRVAEVALADWAEQTGEDLRGRPEAVARVRSSLEVLRPDFRRNPTVDLRVELPHAGDARSEGTLRVSRSAVEEHSEDLVGAICREAQILLQGQDMSPQEVGAVACAGSTGLFPHLVEALGSLFGVEPLHSLPPTHVKLQGLLREAKALERRERSVAPGALVASIGVELPGGRFRPLVHAGAELPATLQRRLPPARSGSPDVELVLYQGEGELARLCTHLGSLKLDRLPLREPPALELHLDIDGDGILTARLTDTQSRRNARLRVATQQTSAERRRAVGSGPSSSPEPRRGLLSRWFGS